MQPFNPLSQGSRDAALSCFHLTYISSLSPSFLVSPANSLETKSSLLSICLLIQCSGMSFHLQLLLPCPLLSPPCLNKASTTFCMTSPIPRPPPLSRNEEAVDLANQGYSYFMVLSSTRLWNPYFLLPFSTTLFHFFQDFSTKFTFSWYVVFSSHSWGTQHPWEGANILTSGVLS